MSVENAGGVDNFGKQRIAVDGATGYLGSHLVAHLRSAGRTVRAIVHAGARPQDVDFLRSTGAEIVVASLSVNDQQLVSALKDCAVVVHLIGSIAPKKGERLEDLHGDQTRNLSEAARAAGVGKIVQVTALGTNQHANNGYHATKWQAEQFVQSSGCKYVILRPSLIIGRQVGNRDSKLVARYLKLIETRPAVPVIGGGSNKIQPVFVGDLVAALEQAIIRDDLNNSVYEIGGDEVLAMRDFVSKLIHLSGSNKGIKGIPVFAAGIAAAFCQTFQNVPLVTSDQIKLSTEDNICRENALTTKFGIKPMPVESALKTYFSNVRSTTALKV